MSVDGRSPAAAIGRYSLRTPRWDRLRRIDDSEDTVKVCVEGTTECCGVVDRAGGDSSPKRRQEGWNRVSVGRLSKVTLALVWRVAVNESDQPDPDLACLTDRRTVTDQCGQHDFDHRQARCRVSGDGLEKRKHVGMRRTLESGARIWDAAGDGGFYESNMSDDGVCLLPVGSMDKAATIDAIGQADPWQGYEFDDVEVRDLDGRGAVIAYRARANRTDGDDYTALDSTVYRRVGETWKLLTHQQTPLQSG